MSGRNGYGNGYGYSDAGRYDNDGAYGSNSNLGVNGYSGRAPGSSGGSRERRPGGYEAYYPESTQQPAPSPERRRDQFDRDRQQPTSQSASRSRARNGDDRRYQGSRDERPREAPRHGEGRIQDTSVPNAGVMQANTQEMRSVEGSFVIGCRAMSSSRYLTEYLVHYSGFAIDPTRLGFHERCRMHPGAGRPQLDGHKYLGQGRPRAGVPAYV